MKNTRWCRFLKAVKKSNPQIRAMLNWVIASITGVICFLNLLLYKPKLINRIYFCIVIFNAYSSITTEATELLYGGRANQD